MHDPCYGRTAFLNKRTNRCNVSAMGDTTAIYCIAEKIYLLLKNLLQTAKKA